MNDLISVLMPVYNVEKYVVEAVNSILNQSYKNIEIIIVDDCSIDHTYDILRQNFLKKPSVHLYRNETNRKIADTLNFALTKAKGQYIARMDGDDICDPLKLQKQYDFLQSHPDIALVGTNYSYMKADGTVFQAGKICKSPEAIKKLLSYQSAVPHIWMTRKTVYDMVGHYRMSGVEDYDFLLRLTSLGLKCSNLAEDLYTVRVREGNSISSLGVKQYKAAIYAYKLYQQRCISSINKDSFSDNDYLENISTTSREEMVYKNFMEAYTRIRMNQHSLIDIIKYSLLAFYSSPKYFTRYLMSRISANRILNSEN